MIDCSACKVIIGVPLALTSADYAHKHTLQAAYNAAKLYQSQAVKYTPCRQTMMQEIANNLTFPQKLKESVRAFMELL